jgi:hypothetical protein
MKKLLLPLLLVGACVVPQAQSYKTVGENTWFLSLGAGGVYYQHSGESQFSVPTATVNLGCWITRPLAFRFGFDMMMTPSHYQNGGSNSSMYFMGSAEFLWDVNATFFNVYNGTFLKPFPFYPMLGVGMVMRPSVAVGGVEHGWDDDFQAMLGFHFPVRIASLWDAFLEYKWFFLSQHYDGSENNNFMHSITLGVTHRWSDNPFSRKTEFSSRSTAEDWWVGFGIGPNFSSYSFRNIDEWDMYGITPEIQFGRNFSNVWTIRFELSGLTAHEPFDTVENRAGATYKFSNLHTDVLVNLTHALSFTRGVRLNVLPYLGAGLIWRYDELTFNMTCDFGVMLRYYLGHHSDIYLDAKYMFVPPTIAGIQPEAGQELSKAYTDWGAMPSITVGYIYNFGTNSTRYRYPAKWSPNR